MDTRPSKESEKVTEVGEVETKVDTVDYMTSAGQGQQKRDVQVIHKSHVSTGSGEAGILAGAAAAAAVSIQSAKDAMSGK